MTGPFRAAKPAQASKPAPFRGSGPFLQIAPKASLPLRHFAFAACAFWTFAAAFAWGSDRFLDFGFKAFWVLGLVHILTLGWVAMTLLGALTQMIPAHGETPLASPRLIAMAWWLLAGGLLTFVGLLWSGSTTFWPGAAAAATAVCLYLGVFIATMRRARKFEWTYVHLACGLGYLAALATMGLLLAYDREGGFIFSDSKWALVAHVHLALVGWVSMSIIGASYRLVPAISLYRLESRLPSRLALGLLNAGLIGLAADALLWHRWIPLWASLLACGFLCYAYQAKGLLAHWRESDASQAMTMLALAGGATWVALGVCLAFGWLPDTIEHREAYVFAALIGWVTPFILAQVHKIAPFLVWLHVYSPRDWTPPIEVPKIEDITSRRLAWGEFAFMIPAVVFGIAGFLLASQALIRTASVSLLIVATLFLLNTALSLRHLAFPLRGR